MVKRARPDNPDAVLDQRAAALTAAALEGARRLGLSPADTANVLGVAQGALVAMKKGERAVDGHSGEAESADALVRIVKRLQALLGDADTNLRSWIRRDHEAFDGPPLGEMLKRQGAEKVARFLERTTSL